MTFKDLLNMLFWIDYPVSSNIWILITTHVLLVSHSATSNSLQPQRTEAQQASLPSLSPRVCSNSYPLSRWCHPTSHLLLLPSPPALNLSQYQGLFQWVSFSHQVAKVLEFQLQHKSFQWIFRTDFFKDWLFFISLQSKGLTRIFSNTAVQKHQFFGAQLSL